MKIFLTFSSCLHACHYNHKLEVFAVADCIKSQSSSVLSALPLLNCGSNFSCTPDVPSDHLCTLDRVISMPTSAGKQLKGNSAISFTKRQHHSSPPTCNSSAYGELRDCKGIIWFIKCYKITVTFVSVVLTETENCCYDNWKRRKDYVTAANSVPVCFYKHNETLLVIITVQSDF